MALHLVPRGLLYVESVAEHGSIQGAARASGIAASAIDRQIKLIEDRLGTVLFDRQRRGMDLTPAGEMFVLLSRRWRADESRILSDIKQMMGQDFGHIRLATMDSLVNGVVPTFLASLARAHPRVRVDVEIATPDGAAELLDDGGCDMALSFNLPPHRDRHVLWQIDLPLHCIAAPGHPLAGRAKVRLQDVRRHAIVVQSRALSIRRMLEARHSWMFSESPPPVATNSLQLLKRLVTDGSHVALTSEMDAAPELIAGSAVAIPVVGANVAAQSISLAINTRRTLPRIASIVAQRLADEADQMLRELRGAAKGAQA